jgi:hypothetical protein
MLTVNNIVFSKKKKCFLLRVLTDLNQQQFVFVLNVFSMNNDDGVEFESLKKNGSIFVLNSKTKG